MKTWIRRTVVIGSVLAVGGLIVVVSGAIPINASSGHWAVTEWFLRFSMKRSIATHSLTVKVPPGLTDPNLVLQGAAHYELGCRSCHGAPGQPRSPLVRGMLPVPPELAPRIRDSNPKRLFYVVKHGLKFTGMPAWPTQQRDDEVWAMVAFLLKYPELDLAGYQRLVEGAPTTAGAGQRGPTSAPMPTAAHSCIRCHGSDGLNRATTFPKLAQQRQEYLENALHAYAQGKRHSGTMEPVAAALSRDQVRQVAAYYAGLNQTRSGSIGTAAPDHAALDRGEKIAVEGIPDRRVPSCLECHGVGGKRRKPEYPSLAAQPATYLQLQLELFARGQRGGSAYEHLMRPIATRLTAAEMRDVTLYFESLPAGNNGTARTQP